MNDLFDETTKKFLNSIGSYVYVADAKTCELLFVNNRILSEYGEGAQLIGRPCWSVLQQGQDGPCDFCPIHKSRDVREETIFWQNRNTATGKYYRNMTTFLEYPSGRAIYVQNAVDITDFIEKELGEHRIARENADRANRAKSDFLSRMSHEMRTPLNAIIGMTNIALSTEDDERRDYCLKQIESASNQLMGVINDILDMSKIEAEELELSFAAFDLELMIDRILSITGYEAEKKNQKIRIYTNSDIPRNVVGDEMHLSQVLTNILSNAIKFTPEGGNIILNIWQADLPNAENGDVLITFELIDDGIGISKEQQQHLFDSYDRASLSRAHNQTGSGLGLSISKRLVNMMGGELEVESSLGTGSTFRFTVRLRIDESRQEAGKTTFLAARRNEGSPGELDKKLSGLGARRILLAEDIEVNREIIALFFEGTNLRLDFAENGACALDLFEQNQGQYDLIFMDIQMPVMDGYEAARKIRASRCKNAATVPIVAMTANVFKEDIERCMNAGMNAHLAKPVSKDELFEKIISMLAGS